MTAPLVKSGISIEFEIVSRVRVSFFVEDGVVAALPRRHRNVP